MRLLVIALFVLLYFTAYYLLAPSIDVMWKEGLIPGDEATWRIYGGFLRTIPATAGVVLTVPVAMIADKYGVRRVLLALGLLMSIGLIAMFAVHSYIMLLSAFTVFGIGMSCIWAPLMSLIAEILPPEKRGLGYAVYYASTIFGFILALVVGVLIHWRTAFTSIGLLLLILLFVLYVRISEGEGKAVSEEVREFSLKGLKEAITPLVVAMLILVLAWGIPWGTLTTYSVDYLVSVWGLEKGYASLILIVSAVSIIIGHMLGGVLADRGLKRGDRLARVKISVFGVAVGTIVMLSFVLYPYPRGSHEISVLLPPLLLAGFGMMFTTLPYPNINAVISEIAKPEYKTTVFSLASVLNTIGWNYGPTIYGALVAFYSTSVLGEAASTLALKYAISTVILLWLIPLSVWIILWKHYSRTPRTSM
ncbi:MAG: MFS transporter [Desulfurococcaceae archaeon]